MKLKIVIDKKNFLVAFVILNREISVINPKAGKMTHFSWKLIFRSIRE